MKAKPATFLRAFFTEPRWEKVRNIFWFFVITFAFHVLWRIWANEFHFAPFSGGVSATRSSLVQLVYNETVFILKDILNVTLYLEPHAFITKNGIRLYLGESSAGLKQICQFLILMLLFGGSWKNKLWFIPLGIIIVHLTNVFRIICMVVIAMHWPQQIHYAHENYLRILNYIVIFLLWLFWMEKAGNLKARDIFSTK